MANSAAERRDFISKRSLCFNCFGPHRGDNCKSSITCQKCKGKHHTSIHEESPEHCRETERQQDRSPAPPGHDNQEDPGATGSRGKSSSSRSTAIERIDDSLNSPEVSQGIASSSSSASRSVDGSPGDLQSSGTSSSRSERAGLSSDSKVIQESSSTSSDQRVVLLATVKAHAASASGDSGSTRGAVKVTLHCRFDLQDQVEITAHVLAKLTSTLPSIHCTKAEENHLQDLQLAYNNYLKPGSIDIIIEADHYGQIIRNEINKLPDNQLVAQQTIFGWIVSGTVCCTDCKPKSSLTAVREFSTEQLLDLLKKFWIQEEFRSTKAEQLNPEAQECELHFQETHTRDSEERYGVGLPLKTSPSVLGDSRRTAFQLLHRTAKKLETNLKYGKLYKDFIKEYEDLGHMRRVSESSEPSPVHYLPHHGVLRKESITTKLRVVFNGSNEGHRFPLAAVFLTKKRYVDDIYGGAESEEQLKDLISQLINLCMAGGLSLQKRILNHQGVLQELKLSTKSTSAVQFEDTTVKVLGLCSNPYLDIFICKSKKSSPDKITKRTIRSEIA
ncbi:uncharacterized protein LOC107045537 [Diachasma alloeum]|uniref:uncharacterized protein LOC107045537 n=1 Tax=Diachasma alloeum TaxID=454923 RepID=UPI0007382F16|nr:uncharacterized protein LOC107045537 [Diachasma alloeum]